MRASVRTAFVGFSIPLEALVHWMYADIKGYITTAIGVKIDPMKDALSLPWIAPGGSPASQGMIASEWIRVHGMTCMAAKASSGSGQCPWKGTRKCLAHLGSRAAQGETRLRLTDDGVELVTARKMVEMDQALAHRFPDWEEWPADAQLATLSLSWACGPSFHYPILDRALRQRDYATAAAQCHINEEGNPGVIPRNSANVAMYRNASHVVRQQRDPEVLVWPEVADDDIPTEPEITNPASNPTIVVAPVHVEPSGDCDDDVA